MKKEIVFTVLFVLGSLFSTANAGARGNGKICNTLQLYMQHAATAFATCCK